MTDITDFDIHWHTKLDSTNIFLKNELLKSELEEYYVACTKSQFQGKGQGSNKWESEPYKNLTFSLLLKPTFVEIQKQFIISKAISLAIVASLNKLKTGFCIKWPNDIYYKKNKIAGILIENSLSQDKLSTSIIGIGLNVNQTNFISDAPNPISLAQIIDNETDINILLSEILASIKSYYLMIKSGETQKLNESYFNALFRKDGIHKYKDDGGYFNASIKDISEYGHLILETTDTQEKIFAFKEVEFIL